MKTKAYQLNNSNFNEPWFAPEITVYADTRGEAKQLILAQIRWYDHVDKYDEPIGFLNIKVVRAKHLDLKLVNGEYKTQFKIDEDKRYDDFNAELDKLLIDYKGGFAYVKKGGSYYRPNSCGYTEFRTRAGIYTIQEAVREVRGCSLMDCMQAVPIDKIEHNKLLQDEIDSLSSRLLPL